MARAVKNTASPASRERPVKEGAEKVFALIEAIEELDDVQNVYANFDVSDEIMATLS